MTVKVFTECGSKSGYGHIYRCLSLIEILINYKFLVIWHIKLDTTLDEIPNLPGKVKVIDWRKYQFSSLHKPFKDLCIFDSYRVNLDEYLPKVNKGINSFIVSITDGNLNYYSNGIVLFPSLYSEKFVSRINSSCILSGPDYFLVNSIVNSHINQRREKLNFNISKNIGISLGGTSNSSIINKIVEIVRNIEEYANLYLYSNDYNGNEEVKLLGFLPKEKYIKSIIELDLLITSSGQSLNEAILLGIPVIPIAVNKSQIYNRDYWLNELGMITTFKKMNENTNDFITYYLKNQEKIKVLDNEKRKYIASGNERTAKKLYNLYVKHIE